MVATRDRALLLGACLTSLREALGERDELIVVDSASRDSSARDVAETHDARYLRADRPGASRARNLGWRAATYPVVAFVDDDVRVSAGWADQIRAVFARRPDLAFATGMVTVPRDQRDRDRPVAVMDSPEARSFDVGSVNDLGHGASVAIARVALERVGGYDELLGPGARFCAAEDHDLFDRMLLAGFEACYEPAIKAEHEQWRGRLDLLRLDYRYGVGAGARASKLLRWEGSASERAAARRRGWMVVRTFLWELGFKRAWRGLWERYEFGMLVGLAKVGGTLSGLALGMLVPVRSGRFAPRRATRPGGAPTAP